MINCISLASFRALQALPGKHFRHTGEIDDILLGCVRTRRAAPSRHRPPAAGPRAAGHVVTIWRPVWIAIDARLQSGSSHCFRRHTGPSCDVTRHVPSPGGRDGAELGRRLTPCENVIVNGVKFASGGESMMYCRKQGRRNVMSRKARGRPVKIQSRIEQNLTPLRYRSMQICAPLGMINHSPYKSLCLKVRETCQKRLSETVL